MKATTAIHQAYKPNQTVFSAPEIGTYDTLYEDNGLSSQKNSNAGNQNSQDQTQKGNSSLMTVAFNIINTAIGGGILGYPYIIRQMGVVTGIFMILLGGALTCFSASIMLKVKNLCGISEYTGIAQTCFKKAGRVLSEVIIVVNTLGGCIIYLVVFTTVVQNLLEAFVDTCNPDGAVSFYCKPTLITIFGALIVLPFNFMKDMEKLKVIGILKVTSIFIFTGITIAFALHKAIMGELDSDVDMFPNFQDPVAMLASIPQIIFGFNFLYNQFSLFNSMKNPQDSKFNKTTIFSMTFVGLVYIAVGVCGYLIYGSSTDNMLKNFKKEDLGAVWFCVLNFAFLVCSLGGIPVTFFPAREILYASIMKRLAKRKSHDDYTTLADDKSFNLSESRSLPSQPQKNKKAFVSLVLITNVLIVLTAIVAPGLNQVLGVIGSIGSSSLMFLFPMAFYLFLTRGRNNSKVLPIIVIAFGVVVAISGFITNLMTMISS